MLPACLPFLGAGTSSLISPGPIAGVRWSPQPALSGHAGSAPTRPPAHLARALGPPAWQGARPTPGSQVRTGPRSTTQSHQCLLHPGDLWWGQLGLMACCVLVWLPLFPLRSLGKLGHTMAGGAQGGAGEGSAGCRVLCLAPRRVAGGSNKGRRHHSGKVMESSRAPRRGISAVLAVSRSPWAHPLPNPLAPGGWLARGRGTQSPPQPCPGWGGTEVPLWLHHASPGTQHLSRAPGLDQPCYKMGKRGSQCWSP